MAIQLRSNSIHSVDVERAKEGELTSETQPYKKRKIRLKVPDSLKRELMPPRNTKELKKFFLAHIPILSWLWSYQPKFLIGDIIAGITISIMQISEGMAYAALAELPPVYGLYTSFMTPLIYAVFGTSRHVSTGTSAVTSLVIGNVVRRIIDANPSLCVSKNLISADTVNATDVDSMQFDYPDCPASVDIAITMTFVYALIMLLFGLLRLGFMTTLLSEPLISGFLTGAAMHLITSQLRHIMGVPSSAIRVNPGVFSLQRTWGKLVVEFVSGRLNWATLIVSVFCITFLVLMQLVNAQLWKFHCYKKLPIPIPSQLIAIIVATLISSLTNLNEEYNTDILGEISTGVPPLTMPKLSYLSDVIMDTIIIAIVIFYADMTVEKMYAKKHGYVISPNQEFFAFGIMNSIGTFFSCFISSLALSRSIVQDVTGGKTQAVAFVSSSILLIVLLTLGPLFKHLPKAILSSIIIVALQGMFMKAKDIKKYYQLSIPDMFTWIVTCLTTLFLGIDLGLVVGAGFGMLLIVVRTFVPISMSLGKDNNDFASYNEDGSQIPGVLIFRFIAPICYTNAHFFATKLAAACDIDPEKWNNVSSSQPGCIEVAYHKLRCHRKDADHDDKLGQLEAQTKITANGDAYHDSQNVHNNSNKNLEEQITNNDKNQIYQHPDLQYIIIDMAPVTFIDSSGSNMLERVKSDYSSCGIQLVLAATSKHNMKTLEHSGFVSSLGAQWFLPSIQAAVDFIKKQKSLDDAKTVTNF